MYDTPFDFRKLKEKIDSAFPSLENEKSCQQFKNMNCECGDYHCKKFVNWIFG